MSASSLAGKTVIVTGIIRQPDGNWARQTRGEAMFLDFGIDFEELSSGVATFSTAIVCWPDGLIENIPLQYITRKMP
jgi:hypothetical protein